MAIKIKKWWQQEKLHNKYHGKIKKYFILLYGEKQVEDRIHGYYIEKIKLLSIILGVGIFLMIILEIASYGEQKIEDGKYILRNEKGEGEQIIELFISEVGEAEDITVEKESITIVVEEQSYTKEELELLLTEAIETLEQYILGENESLDYISQNMKLVNSLPNMPFSITWSCSDYSLLQIDGSLGNREPMEEGELVRLNATIAYEDLTRDVQFFVMRKQPILTENEVFLKEVQEQLQLKNENTNVSEYMELPTEVSEKVLLWEEKRESLLPIILLILGSTMVAIFIGKDQELEKQVIKREEELKKEYADFVVKLSLFLGAGITIRGAFFRMGNEYKLQKDSYSYHSVLYEEILVLCNQLNTGISEKEAYAFWGKRCNTASYRKLAALLNQNLKKGSSGLLVALQLESQNAIEEKRNFIRKKGEEASTKLLLPMILMLGMVMIIIMIPAYLSFI